FRYPGSKASPGVRRWILSHAPGGFKKYREPFVGGGGVFFAVSQNVTRWINDAHAGLTSVYLALRDRPQQFIAACRAIARDDDRESRFNQFVADADGDQALRYLFLNRTGFFSGRVREGRMSFGSPGGWRLIHTAVMERAARRLAHVRLTCGDFE